MTAAKHDGGLERTQNNKQIYFFGMKLARENVPAATHQGVLGHKQNEKTAFSLISDKGLGKPRLRQHTSAFWNIEQNA